MGAQRDGSPKGPHKEKGSQSMEIRGVPPQRDGTSKGWDLKGMTPQRDGIPKGWELKGSPHKEKGSQSMEIKGVPLQRDVNPKVHPIRRGAAGSWRSEGSHPKEMEPQG